MVERCFRGGMLFLLFDFIVRDWSCGCEWRLRRVFKGRRVVVMKRDNGDDDRW